MGSGPWPGAQSLLLTSVEEDGASAVELSLGLSVGGATVDPSPRVPISPSSTALIMSELRWRRDYQALRRMEARRKQEEKLMRKTAAELPAPKAQDASENKYVASQSAPEIINPAPVSARQSKAKPATPSFSGANTNASMNTPAVGYAALPMQYVPCTANPYSFSYMVPCWGPPIQPSQPAAPVLEQGEKLMPSVAALGVPVLIAGKENVAGEKSSADALDFLDVTSRDDSTGVAGGSKSTSSNETKSESSLTVATADGSAQPPAGAIIPYYPLPSPENTEKNGSAVGLLPPKELETRSPPGTVAEKKRKKGDGGAEKSRGSPEKMPCVAARGDGPEGKTITGYLYRYTKEEVSIMCVCHCRSFSPAEFLRHAGYSETSEPLRKIVVVPPWELAWWRKMHE